MDGFPSLFALVGADGFIDPGSTGGITQENVRRVDQLVTPEDGEPFLHTFYCFSGLSPVSSGQVTLQGVRLPIINVPYLVVESEETRNDGLNDCSVRVYLVIEGQLGAADFHVLLY
ncbi:MAG: hypothetical protein ACREWE_06540 [Gammaproteobacteria bacterium]